MFSTRLLGVVAASVLSCGTARKESSELETKPIEEQRPRPGVRALGLGEERDGVLFVPAGVDPSKPAPLVVMLHGAGGSGRDILGAVRAQAEREGVIVIAPDSREGSWDLIVGRIGPDVAFVQRALDKVMREYAIDADRVAVAGFSDGASYALTLGLPNRAVFTHIIAFSPGFHGARVTDDAPPTFISHGTHDRVLPIDPCSRRIVPGLKSRGVEVDYREFDGGHTMPAEIVDGAFKWFFEVDGGADAR